MQAKLTVHLISIGLVCGAVASLWAADLPIGRSSDPLLAAIERLDQRPAEPAATLAAARQRLAASTQQLQQYLSRAGGETANRWSQWLGLAQLTQELENQQPNAVTLRQIEERLYQNQEGLELPAFVALRRELHAFLMAHDYAAAASPQELYRQRLAELSARLSQLELEPSEHEAHQAGVLLGWFESLDDGGAALAREARSRLCRTNMVGQASGRLANYLLARSVYERNYIAETVLGSFTRGVAITQGQVLFATVPNSEQGTLEIHLQGRVVCPANVADRRRISVYNSSLTSIDARKQMFLDDQGLHLARAAASGSTNIEIQDVDARRVVQRMVWRRASRMMPEAEALTSRRAESEAASKLDQQANAALGNMNNIFCQKIRAPLIRLNALPEQMHFWTDATHLRLALNMHNESQLSAAGPAPALPASYDLAGCVHESMINNLCESMLGGRTIHDEAWLETMHLLLGERPRQLWVHDRAERWAVVFSKEQPLRAHCQNDRFGFTLRLAEVQRGDQTLRGPMEIEVRFVPQIDRDGPWLARDGELTIRVPSDIDPQTETSLRTFLTRKFGAVFPPELHFYGLMPPAGGTMGKLCQLRPAEFRANGGWLSVAYELAGEQ